LAAQADAVQSRYGRVGLFAFPYFAVFELIGPFIETFGYSRSILSYLWASSTSSSSCFPRRVDPVRDLPLRSPRSCSRRSRSAATRVDRSDKLLTYSVLENFGYRQLLSAMKVKAFWDAVRRRRAWGQMQRRGFQQQEQVAPSGGWPPLENGPGGLRTSSASGIRRTTRNRQGTEPCAGAPRGDAARRQATRAPVRRSPSVSTRIPIASAPSSMARLTTRSD
jgi:hypothetical protein